MALPEPITRREKYLAKAAGMAVTLPETDLTREEQYLRAIAEGGGGGGTPPFYPAGNIEFANLPELSADILGAMYNVTDAFTTDSRFNEGAGVDYPAGTNVAVVNTGTAESPVLKYDTFAGAYVVDSALSDASENPVQNKVIKSALDGKATPADIAALIDDTTAAQNKAYSSAKVEEKVAGEEITTTATGTDLTLSTSEGSLNALTVYGKSEVVDGSIISAGEGYAVVRLADLTWNLTSRYSRFYAPINPSSMYHVIGADENPQAICNKYTPDTTDNVYNGTDKTIGFGAPNIYLNNILVCDKDYTTVSDFVASLGDATLCYQLADPTQGNAIAVKTDNDSGIDGTMAVLATGTPLRGIPETDVRDVMQWDGTSGEVTENCAELDLGTLNWAASSAPERHIFRATFAYTTPLLKVPANGHVLGNYLCAEYLQKEWYPLSAQDDGYYAISETRAISLIDHDYDNVADFVAHINGVKFVYELATPTTQSLTPTENASLAALRTFTPQTHAQNNAQTEMTVEAYAGTANGQAVNELKQDVQSEISALKITQSATLTLTVAGWSNNAQTVSYAHDTAKRNVIDVDTSSIEEWANCSILATAETTSGITFSCKTVPENALTFRVTSMGVN